ncbi:MAG: hypothetical protein GC164_14760 [Phycisphaera sp.]|nr:hypothetical protein [Phycisphaera sp.]
MPSPMANVAVLRAACCIAGLDKHIDEQELKLLERIADYAGVGKASLSAMIDRAKNDEDFYEDQFKIVLTDPKATMTALFAVAVADGKLGDNERIILCHFADRLGLPEREFDALYRAALRKTADRPPK